VREIRQSEEIVEPDLDLYWAKASTALTVFRLLHEVGISNNFPKSSPSCGESSLRRDNT